MPHYLVTGGTGSFGSACIAELLRRPETNSVRVYSRNEHRQQELAERVNRGCLNDGKLRCVIGDVRDKDRLKLAMAGVDVVIHAAALKSVPVAEYNPIECVRTNVDGTVNAIEAALYNGVRYFLAISSDKAVAPLNLYGATKAVMERLVTQANAYRGSVFCTKFSCVRYGNVVGSASSVVRVWRRQMDAGEPLTVTSFEATRFWITMPQAVDFVLSSLELMRDWDGGELFIPKLSSVRLSDLYQAMKNGSPYRQVGLRPGEKMHECLLLKEEMERSEEMSDRYVVVPEHPSWPYAFYPEGRLHARAYTSGENDFLAIDRIRESVAAC